MIVVFTDESVSDLERIGDYIAVDNPVRALSFVRELKERCLGLEHAWKSFALVPRYADRGVRRRVYRSYAIFYRASGMQIDILHVLHSAQDYETILFPES